MANGITNSRQQARYWIATVPYQSWEPELPDGASWCVGQGEEGESGYRHWQFVVAFPKKITLTAVRRVLPRTGHYEPTRSTSAEGYVQKEESRIENTSFEFGEKILNRNCPKDWEKIKQQAISGDLTQIPADVFIRYYGSLRRIAADFGKPDGIEKSIFVFYGPTGTGKSRRAFEEGGNEAYFKCPRSKFWCGYRGQENVIVDEFRGGIDISHILRWCDRYPVRVETKGASEPLRAKSIWFTSNLHPRDWYPDLDPETFRALERRMTIINLL